MDSSDAFIMNYENKSLPFILANSGYDVWLGNNRGNKYSRNHSILNPDDNKDKDDFWNFSFHEMGIYDLPAMINYIKNQTISEESYKEKPLFSNSTKITYIGHSQGTSQLFAALTLMPNFFEKNLNGFIALGPVTSLKNLSSTLLRYMVKFKLADFLGYLGFREVFPNIEFVSNFQTLICDKFGIICSKALEVISDYSTEDDDMERFVNYISHFPSGASLDSFLALIQNIMYQPFASFREMIPYEFENLRNRNIKIAMFVGEDDRLATPQDNRILKGILEEKGVLDFYKEYEKTGHISFFISKSNLFMDDIVRKIDEYWN